MHSLQLLLHIYGKGRGDGRDWMGRKGWEEEDLPWLGILSLLLAQYINNSTFYDHLAILTFVLYL